MTEFKSVMAGENDEVLAEEKESEILEAVKKQSETEAKLYRKLAPLLVLTKGAESAELETAMSTILSAEEIQLIKDTFLFETYLVEVYTCSVPGPNSFVRFLREGKNIFPTITLISSNKVKSAEWIQWASVVVELFMLALSAIGIKVFVNDMQMAKICKTVEKIIKTPAFKKALNAFKQNWANGDKQARAKAIFYFLKDSYTAGIFWQVIKAVLAEMTWLDYAKTVATITLMIVAAFATGGAVLIAKILLALDSAYTLVQKMRNLEALEMVEVLLCNYYRPTVLLTQDFSVILLLLFASKNCKTSFCRILSRNHDNLIENNLTKKTSGHYSMFCSEIRILLQFFVFFPAWLYVENRMESLEIVKAVHRSINVMS